MEPLSCLAMVGTIAAVINGVATQIMDIKALHDKIKIADVHLMSLIAQLNSIKAALVQIQDLIQACHYDKQLEMDLELSLQASRLHMDYIGSKISKLKTKNAASALKFHSRVRVVFESVDMDACVGRLNHQATALNLLITVLTSKSVTEQKNMLQRSNTRKVFKQIQEDQASMLDDTASLRVQRDVGSVRHAAIRMKSAPIINKSPWKGFAFDRQILSSKAYGKKSNTKETIEENVPETDQESIDEAATLVEQPDTPTDSVKVDISALNLPSSDAGTVRFTRMLALGGPDSNISGLIAHAQHLWNAQSQNPTQTLSISSPVQNHRLSTRYFDVSIHVHSIDDQSRRQVNDEFLASYRDVSSILFAANLSAYQKDPIRLQKDLVLFARTANDYHLWLAKIVLFLDTTGLDPYGAQGISMDVAEKFLRAAKAGASNDRIHILTGQVDEMAAGTIFAVCNESGRVQENKYAGLTRSPTY